MKWKHAITVVVAEGDASSYDPAAPALRKISMDKVVFAFLLELKKRLRKVEVGCIPLGFLRAARHVPVNYVLIPASAAHEEHVYVYAMQIMEDFRTAEEEHAPTAWALCQMWATARDMKQKAGAASEDSAGAVADMLQKIRCGKTCDYAEKGLIVKRVVQDALTLHDRVLAAGVGDSLSYAGAEFGPRSPLTNLCKLVKLSQLAQATAVSRKAVPGVLLRRTVQVMLLRLELSLTDVQEGIGCLGKTEIPRCILIGELLAEAAALLPGSDQPKTVQALLLALSGSESVPKPSAMDAAAREALHPPVKAGLSWATKLLMGNLDAVLREIVHQDTKKISAKQLLMHGKLGWASDVQPKLDSDAEARQRKAVATAASARGLAGDDLDAFAGDVLELAASVARAPSAAPLADAAGGEAGAAEKADAAEENPSAQSIVPLQAGSPAEVRAAFAKSQLDKFLHLDVVPALGAAVGDWATLLAKITAECFGISRGGVQLHGWVLDAASDAEPALQEREDVFARPPLVEKFLAERFFAAAGLVTPQGRQFMLLAPARSEGDATTLLKSMTAKPHEEAVADHLTIVYKEKEKGRAGKRFRTKLVERVLAFVSKAAEAVAAAAPLNKKCNRLFFTATSTMSDCIINAPPPDEKDQPRLTLERKAKIMAGGGALPAEASSESSKAADLCSLLHHEKAPDLWAEVFHHYRASSVATATPGAGAILKGAISLGMRAAALCKNEEHKAFLLEELLAWAVSESQRPFSWCYRSDADLGMKEIEGLPEDEEADDGNAEEEGEEEDLAEEEAEEEEEAESEKEAPPASAKAKKRAAAKQAAATLKASAAEASRKAKAEGPAQRKEVTRNKKGKAEELAEPPGKAGSGKAGMKRSAREAGLQERGEPAADQLCKAGSGKVGGKKRSPQEAAELEEDLRPLKPGGKLGSKRIQLKQPSPAVSCPAGALALFRARTTGRGGSFLPRL